MDSARGQASPIKKEEAAALAVLVGFGPAPQSAAWKAGAEGLAAAGLAAHAGEGELAVDPAVRFSC